MQGRSKAIAARDVFKWSRRGRGAAQLAQANADALIRGHGEGAYRLARTSDRDYGAARRHDAPGPHVDALAKGRALGRQNDWARRGRDTTTRMASRHR